MKQRPEILRADPAVFLWQSGGRRDRRGRQFLCLTGLAALASTAAYGIPSALLQTSKPWRTEHITPDGRRHVERGPCRAANLRGIMNLLAPTGRGAGSAKTGRRCYSRDHHWLHSVLVGTSAAWSGVFCFTRLHCINRPVSLQKQNNVDAQTIW